MTKEGDYLLEYPPSIPNHHTDDSDLANEVIGVHRVCNGFVDRMITTLDGGVIRCRRCSLRIYVPITVITFGDLRKYLEESWI